MARSKGRQARRVQQQHEEEELAERPVREAEARRLTTEGLFRDGELLSQAEIENRIEQSGLVRRADDEFFRLLKAKFFKRSAGRYLVRGD